MSDSGVFWSWETLRLVNFCVLFLCFVILVYKGVLKLVIHPEAFSWARLMNLVWCALGCYGIGEVLYKGTEGGPRVLLQTLVAFMQLWVVLFKWGFYESDPLSKPPVHRP